MMVEYKSLILSFTDGPPLSFFKKKLSYILTIQWGAHGNSITHHKSINTAIKHYLHRNENWTHVCDKEHKCMHTHKRDTQFHKRLHVDDYKDNFQIWKSATCYQHGFPYTWFIYWVCTSTIPSFLDQRLLTNHIRRKRIKSKKKQSTIQYSCKSSKREKTVSACVHACVYKAIIQSPLAHP